MNLKFELCYILQLLTLTITKSIFKILQLLTTYDFTLEIFELSCKKSTNAIHTTINAKHVVDDQISIFNFLCHPHN